MKICLISTAPAEQWQINHLYLSDCYMTVEGVTPIVVIFNHTHKWRLQWKLQRQLGRTLQAPIGIDCGMMVFNVSDDKQRCICNMQLLLQLMRPLRAQRGHLIPLWARRCPISVPSHLQLGGTLVPRSTRHCLPPPPQLHIDSSPSMSNQLLV